MPRHTVTLTDADVADLSAMRYADGIVALWNRILAACGEPPLGAPERATIRPGDYAIPRDAWVRLSQAWIDNAPEAERSGVCMHYVNVGPAAIE